ncbi:F0F1 ATP synthase subunit B/delta [Tsukamurella sp. 8F]|uniref:F0F1 ATP synthase subunit B/delta n=1 Tax=unclassified Tsukamurella TaxID=2633480 RepID=UPI0023B9692D|nr:MULTISPECIES: F0F1 ATP synthase subunit B/delta [unclassified Tsukamurella]MDF0530296.1 F0F1 ATP synthase subunit B/delta [Tsukamurella sp. 8J]MDF0587593.1 F0F1 ATP synthase subunit B/delta [Tsukamurella sp. 8F]
MSIFIGQLIGFAVILFCLWKWLLPPLKKMMRERQEAVRAQLEESRAAQDKLAEAGAAGERARADAAREGSQIRDEARGDADSIRDELREQSDREVARIAEHGRGQVELNRSNLIRGLRGALGAESVDVAGRLVRGHLEDPAARSASIDRTLDELEQMASSVTGPQTEASDRIGTFSLRAASREAVRKLSTGFDARVAELDDAATAEVAADLANVVHVLNENPVLRKHLAEPSGNAEAKRALVSRLFGGKISDTAVVFVQDAAASKWSAPADFSTAIERQARVAVLLRAERAGRIDDTEDELFRAGRLLESEPKLNSLLSDTRVPVEDRVGLMERVFGGKVNEYTAALLRQTVRLLRSRGADSAVASIADLAAARRGESVAHVRSATELTQAQTERATGLLGRIYQRSISIQTEVDPELLGGLRITVGDEVIDGDVASRLAKAAGQLPR